MTKHKPNECKNEHNVKYSQSDKNVWSEIDNSMADLILSTWY